jgi:cobalt-zinc-cadmium efflux system outer membrane protein
MFILVLCALPSPARAQQALTLEAAVDSALASHPSVLAADARVDAADARRKEARSRLLPTVAAGGSLVRFQEPMVVAPLHGFDPTNPPTFDRTLIQGQVGLEYTLFDGGARDATIRSAEASEGAVGFQRDATTMELLEAVATAYTGVLATREVRQAAARQVAALDAEHTRAQQRLREGTAARVEVMRAEAALLDARAQQASADARASLAERNLARLMGLPAGALENRPLDDVAPRAAAVLDSTATTDPRIEAARRAVDAARARLDQERAGRLPSLKASAGLQNYGSSTGDYAHEWQAGVKLSWPVFTGGARSAAIQNARAELVVAQQELRRTELAVSGAVDQADAALAEATARVQALDASVAQWEEVERIEALSLETGAGVQQDYLKAEAALFQARAGRARARYDEILAHVGRARAQGRLDRKWIDNALEVR